MPACSAVSFGARGPPWSSLLTAGLLTAGLLVLTAGPDGPRSCLLLAGRFRRTSIIQSRKGGGAEMLTAAALSAHASLQRLSIHARPINGSHVQ